MPREKRSAAELNEYRDAEKRRQSQKWECHCEKPGCPGGLVSQSTWRTHRAWTEARAQEKKNREGVEDLFAGYPPFHELEPGVDMAVDDVSEPDHERKEPPLIDSDDDIFGDQWPPAPGLADDDLDPPDPNAPVYGPHPQPRHTPTPPNTTCTQATNKNKKKTAPGNAHAHTRTQHTTQPPRKMPKHADTHVVHTPTRDVLSKVACLFTWHAGIPRCQRSLMMRDHRSWVS